MTLRERVRAWFRRWYDRARLRALLCAWRCHPLEVSTTKRYVGTGGIEQTDEWRTCLCGKHSSGITRTRIAFPYEERE